MGGYEELLKTLKTDEKIALIERSYLQPVHIKKTYKRR